MEWTETWSSSMSLRLSYHLVRTFARLYLPPTAGYQDPLLETGDLTKSYIGARRKEVYHGPNSDSLKIDRLLEIDHSVF